MSAFLDLHWNKWMAAPNGCFIWCAARKSIGYGVVKKENGVASAHRLVCEETHGPRAPFLKLTASHICGDARCVRPEHIVWESQQENLNRIPEGVRHAPPRGQRGRNAPPYTLCKKNPKRPYWVRVTVDGSRHTVGYFPSPEEAVAAREAFLKAYYA